MSQKFTNNALSLLAVSIDTASTTLIITSGDEILFPVLISSDTFNITIEFGGVREIMAVTATASNSFTVIRAQDNTTATSFSLGANVSLRLTAGQISSLFPLDMSTGATGTLPTILGGTGQSSYSIGDIITATGTMLLSSLSVGASNTILISTGVIPVYSSDPIVSTVQALSGFKTGSIPAVSGSIRMSNIDQIKIRNSANNADKILIESDILNTVYIGDASGSVSIRNETTFGSQNAALTSIVKLFKFDLNDQWRFLIAPILSNSLVLSSRDNANTVNIPLLEVDSNNDIIFGDLLNRNTGFGLTAPKSRHHFAGSISYPIRTVTANSTYGDDYVIQADTTTASASITLSLPSASNTLGRCYIAKKIGASFTVTLSLSGADTYEDSATDPTLISDKQVRVFMSDGVSNWVQIVGT